ncbi:hypothetical protein [Endozoicomonas sp.]|uniref:hypothetical protein n=1 Tax=Endozoicomonas sp. TaxID=1892382 RepID=UPI00383B0C09
MGYQQPCIPHCRPDGNQGFQGREFHWRGMNLGDGCLGYYVDCPIGQYPGEFQESCRSGSSSMRYAHSKCGVEPTIQALIVEVTERIRLFYCFSVKADNAS